jgi:hypothetical protein
VVAIPAAVQLVVVSVAVVAVPAMPVVVPAVVSAGPVADVNCY